MGSGETVTAEVCGYCHKPRIPDDLHEVLAEECLTHDLCEKCKGWCYAADDRDCEHVFVYREVAELRAAMATVREHSYHTEETRALADALGLREGKHTASSVAKHAMAELFRLRAAVAAYAAAAEVESPPDLHL